MAVLQTAVLLILELTSINFSQRRQSESEGHALPNESTTYIMSFQC